jgi:type II secretory pathway pseudopilin PulG
MRFRIIASVLAVALLAGLSSAKDSPDQKREKTRKMAAQTLQDLYKLPYPSSLSLSASEITFRSVCSPR